MYVGLFSRFICPLPENSLLTPITALSDGVIAGSLIERNAGGSQVICTSASARLACNWLLYKEMTASVGDFTILWYSSAAHARSETVQRLQH